MSALTKNLWREAPGEGLARSGSEREAPLTPTLSPLAQGEGARWCVLVMFALSCGAPIEPKFDGGDPPEMFDAGTIDAGTIDAGTIDAGAIDAGPPPTVDAPALPCSDSEASIYAATPTTAAPGARLACHFERTVSTSDVTAALNNTGPAQPSEVDLYLLAYRTTRSSGQPGVSTARVYLPKTPRPGPLPVIAIAHGSVGIADTCAPSHEAEGLFVLALPWASRGYAVIAPDFAGLGNAGVQGYVDNHDTGFSMLDAVKALRALLRPGALDGRGILVGYSQGGGAVLAAQALEQTYGSGGKLAAVVAVAPQYFTRLNSFGYVNMLRTPDALTVTQGYTKPVVAALRQYAFFTNALGDGGSAFPSTTAAGTVAALESRCLIDLGGWLPANRQRVRDLIDDALRTSFLGCVDGAGCVNPGKRLYDGLQADLLRGDPNGAPVLYLQGGLDTVMPVGEEAACNVPWLRSANVQLTYCTDNLAAHNDIYKRNIELVRTWAEATTLGTTVPTCTAMTPPACN